MVRVGDRAFVAGRVGAPGVLSGGDAALVALDLPSMSEAWSTSWGTEEGTEDALGLATDGVHLYAVATQPGDEGLVILSWDLDGELLWSAPWDGGGGEVGRAIQCDPVDGSVVVAVNAEADDGVDIALLRFDGATGDLLEEERWGGAGDDEVHELVLDGEHGFFAGQTTSWGDGGYDALVVRFGMRPWRLPE